MRYLITILFLFISLIVSGTDYYVKNGGSDAAAGTSDGTAWETITKINTEWAASTFAPGDNIYFNRGDTFTGTIVITESGTSGSPITIGAYGTGDKPIITSLSTLTSWTDEGGSVYSKTVTMDAATSIVIVDGVQKAMGRTPDAGTNYIFTSHTGTTSITDAGIGDTPNWAGAELVINKRDYILDRCLVTDHTGDVFTFTNLGGTREPYDDRYYFVQNDLRCVTATNEWYSDGSKVYIYGNPAAKTVQVATLNYLINNAGYDYITVNGLDFQGAISHAIYCASSSTNWIIQNCSISYAENGIYGAGSTWVVDNNTVSDCNNTGIYLSCSTATISNNTISDIGLISGLSYTGTYCDGIYITGSNFTVEYNNIQRTGYNGIHSASATSFSIANNFIDYAMQILDDGGGIYVPAASVLSRVIDGNIILRTGRDGLDTNYCRGIYLDASASNITVSDNIIAYSASSGIFIGGGVSNTLTGNSLFRNSTNQIFITDYAPYGGTTPTGTVLTYNTMVAPATKYTLRLGLSDAEVVAGFTTSNYNCFARPIADDETIRKETSDSYITLADWQSTFSYDLNSYKSPFAVTSDDEMVLYYNNTQSGVTYNLSTPMVDMAGNSYDTQVTLGAYEGIVLIPNLDPSKGESGTMLFGKDLNGNFLKDLNGNLIKIIQ